jgi:hypothetical protein
MAASSRFSKPGFQLVEFGVAPANRVHISSLKRNEVGAKSCQLKFYVGKRFSKVVEFSTLAIQFYFLGRTESGGHSVCLGNEDWWFGWHLAVSIPFSAQA